MAKFSPSRKYRTILPLRSKLFIILATSLCLIVIWYQLAYFGARRSLISILLWNNDELPVQLVDNTETKIPNNLEKSTVNDKYAGLVPADSNLEGVMQDFFSRENEKSDYSFFKSSRLEDAEDWGVKFYTPQSDKPFSTSTIKQQSNSQIGDDSNISQNDDLIPTVQQPITEAEEDPNSTSLKDIERSGDMISTSTVGQNVKPEVGDESKDRFSKDISQSDDIVSTSTSEIQPKSGVSDEFSRTSSENILPSDEISSRSMAEKQTKSEAFDNPKSTNSEKNSQVIVTRSAIEKQLSSEANNEPEGKFSMNISQSDDIASIFTIQKLPNTEVVDEPNGKSTINISQSDDLVTRPTTRTQSK